MDHDTTATRTDTTPTRRKGGPAPTRYGLTLAGFYALETNPAGDRPHEPMPAERTPWTLTEAAYAALDGSPTTAVGA